jgi:hypothetical protein
VILSAHQPAYLPWLGYFAKMARTDVFVLHDLSRIGRGNMLNRNKIRTADGPLLLTVPLNHTDLRAELPLNQIRVADDGWRARHWRAIQFAYRRAPFFADHADFLASYYGTAYQTLDELCRPFIEYCVNALAIDCSVAWMSELNLPEADRQTIIPLLCEHFGSRQFVAGPHAVSYLDTSVIGESGIRLDIFDYDHPVYPQLREGFLSHLSVLDLLMNCGPDSAELLHEGQRCAR